MNPLGIFALIFLTSGNRNGKLVNEGIARKGNETFLELDSNNFSRNFHSTPDNFLAKNSKLFRRIYSPKKDTFYQKIPKMTEVIEEKIIKKPSRPLEAVIDSKCQRGYQRDQNGICQKAVTVNQEKNFELDRKRRKRFADDKGVANRKTGKPFAKRLDSSSPYWKILENLKDKKEVDRVKVYMGLVSDGVGDCKKAPSIRAFKQS